MDPTEDISARVLLKHILTTEPLRTPITRSVSKAQGNAVKHQPQSSSRSRVRAATPRTPQDILRRSMKDHLHQSISRTSLPASKKVAAVGRDRRVNSPTTASLTFTEEGTPRGILMNILHTEPARSPVVHEKSPAPEPNAPQSVRRTSSRLSSTEFSGLDLGDVTVGNFISPAKGLSRKRQRRSLNVTAFEKRLRTSEVVEEQEQPADDLSLLSLSSTSLSLQTPFAQIHTEKRGLQRRVSNRRMITEEEFGEAVKQRQLAGRGTDTTLSLRDHSDMQVTHDIINCHTALYPHDDHAISSNLSIVATQDKPTVMASQLSRDLGEEQRYMEEDANVRSQSEEDADARSQSEEEVEVRSPSEEDNNARSQSEEDVDAKSRSEEDVDARSRSEEDVDARSRSEEDVDARSRSEEDVDARSRSEEDVDAGSQSEEEVMQSAEEEGVADSADGVQPDEDGDTAYSQTEDEGADGVKEPGEPEEWDEESGPEDLPMETPAFVRQKRIFAFPNAAPLSVNAQAEPSSETRNASPPKPKARRKKSAAPKKQTGLPKSYLMGTFKHFAKTRVSSDVYPVLSEIMEKFFDRLTEDVETYAAHARRKNIEVEDVVLLLKRQGLVSDKVPVEVLIEKHLRMEQRKLLIPIATSGNVVVPKRRRW